MGNYVSQRPAAAVEIHHSGERLGSMPGAHNMQRIFLKIDFLRFDRIAGYVRCLHLAHEGSCLRNGDFVQRRTLAGTNIAAKVARSRFEPWWKLPVFFFAAQNGMSFHALDRTNALIVAHCFPMDCPWGRIVEAPTAA